MADKQPQILAASRDGAQDLQKKLANLGLDSVGRDTSMLTDDEWEVVDNELIQVLREEAVFPQLLREMGITREVNEPGKMAVEFWSIQDRLAATRDLSMSRRNADTVLLSPTVQSNPVTYALVQVPRLALEASRRGSLPARDVLGVREATSIVVDSVNDLLANGDSAYGVDGILGTTGRQAAAGTSWATAGNAYMDVLDMNKALLDKNVISGQRVLFVNQAEAKNVQRVFSSTSQSQLEIIEKARLIDKFVVTPRRGAATATMARFSPNYVKHLVTQPVTVEEVGQVMRAPVFLVWTQQTVLVGKADAVVDRTTLT